MELALCVAATMCVSHMKESRDSTLHVAIAGKRLSRWNGESRMSNVDPLMDLFAMAEGTQHPAVAAMLQQAAAKRLRGTRIVLLTTRAPSSAQRRDLDRIVSEAGGRMTPRVRSRSWRPTTIAWHQFLSLFSPKLLNGSSSECV